MTNLNMRGTYELFITRSVQQVKGRVDPVAAAGQTALDYIDSADFAARHPAAHEKLRGRALRVFVPGRRAICPSRRASASRPYRSSVTAAFSRRWPLAPSIM